MKFTLRISGKKINKVSIHAQIVTPPINIYVEPGIRMVESHCEVSFYKVFASKI